MARASGSDPKDPRFRRFRGASYGLYLVVVALFCGLLLNSVLRSLVAMSPGKLPEQRPLTVAECAGEARILWEELDAERRDLSEHAPVARADERWTSFRTRWLTEYRELEARCALGSQQRKELRRAFSLLLDMMDLYTTHAVQYAGQVGSTLDQLRAALDRLGTSASPDPEPRGARSP